MSVGRTAFMWLFFCVAAATLGCDDDPPGEHGQPDGDAHGGDGDADIDSDADTDGDADRPIDADADDQDAGNDAELEASLDGDVTMDGDGADADPDLPSCAQTDEPCEEQRDCCDETHQCTGRVGDYRCRAPCQLATCQYDGVADAGSCMDVGDHGICSGPDDVPAAECEDGQRGCETHYGVTENTICMETRAETYCFELCEPVPAECPPLHICIPMATRDPGFGICWD